MVKVYVTKVEWCPTFGSNVVALKEIEGERSCNISVREWEAQTISVLLNQNSQQPYKTAWLLSYMLENLDIKIVRVEIQKTFLGEILAKMIYCDRNKSHTITHTPGEAIELAMRCRAPIMIPESFLVVSDPRGQQLEESRVARLKERLEKAIAMEQYEEAAKLRDKILRLKKM